MERVVWVWAGVGAGVWLGAAIALRLLEPFALIGQGALLQAAAAVGTLAVLAGAVLTVRRVLAIPRPRLFEAVSVMTMTALLLDGLAFSFAPWLYGTGADHRLAAAALVMWGGGAGMLVAWWLGGQGAMPTARSTTTPSRR